MKGLLFNTQENKHHSPKEDSVILVKNKSVKCKPSDTTQQLKDEKSFICDICKKGFVRINCECDDCYIKGATNEFNKGKKEALEAVEEVLYNRRVKIEQLNDEYMKAQLHTFVNHFETEIKKRLKEL